MNIGGALRIEPFMDQDGSTGFAVIDVLGEIHILTPDECAQMNEQDMKILDAQANAALQWQMPKKPDMTRFHFVRDGLMEEGVEPGKEWEFYDEYVRTILTPISKRIQRFLNTFCYFEDPRIYALLSSFVIASYFREQFEKMPLLLFDGVSGSGKSTALNALSELCYRGFFTSNYSTASLVDLVAEHDVTILLDESLRNLQSERGADIKTFLINSFDRKTAVYNRKDPDLRGSTVKKHYTSVAVTTLGGEIPIDMRNRAALVSMSLPDEKIDLEDIGYINDAKLNPEDRPESIRTDLNTLKLMTESDLIRKITDPAIMQGISFDYFRQTTKRYLEQIDLDGRYLYGIVNGIANTPKITGRDKAIAYVNYTIGLATGDDLDILKYILSNRESISYHKMETTEAVLFMALSDIIYERYCDNYPTIAGRPETIDDTEIKIICNKIAVADVHTRYRELRRLEGWDDREIEPPKTLTLIFRKLRIPYEERGGRTNYLNAKGEEFLLNFKKAAVQYLDQERAALYSTTRTFFSQPARKTEKETGLFTLKVNEKENAGSTSGHEKKVNKVNKVNKKKE
ncbi:MAG: hypothetical protein LBG63_00960 [Candidatus Methanoplasma sp.]|nr:hypothetical protein [Candidatus Methanoplasma sp.]